MSFQQFDVADLDPQSSERINPHRCWISVPHLAGYQWPTIPCDSLFHKGWKTQQQKCPEISLVQQPWGPFYKNHVLLASNIEVQQVSLYYQPKQCTKKRNKSLRISRNYHTFGTVWFPYQMGPIWWSNRLTFHSSYCSNRHSQPVQWAVLHSEVLLLHTRLGRAAGCRCPPGTRGSLEWRSSDDLRMMFEAMERDF